MWQRAQVHTNTRIQNIFGTYVLVYGHFSDGHNVDGFESFVEPVRPAQTLSYIKMLTCVCVSVCDGSGTFVGRDCIKSHGLPMGLIYHWYPFPSV